jgi:UDP-N-acetylmuramoyl-tripeptide--D-alanyl-D-alanine ligase
MFLATRGNLNNEIGVPITLCGLGHEHDYAVIEMGANHAGEIARLSHLARPMVALITQCAPAHLEGFGSIEGVARAKAEIFTGLDPDGTAILNADDNYFGFWMDTTSRFRQLSFGIKNKADITATDIRFDSASAKTTFLMHVHDSSIAIKLALAGEHNVMNALAAATCCLAVGIPLSQIKTGLEQVVTVNGRMQLKLTPAGTRIFDDTYNANPVSLQAGLKVMSSMPGRKWLVLGDMGELGEHSSDLHREAGAMAREYGLERLYALGDMSKYAVDGFGSGARHFNGTEELLDVIGRELGPDTTLLVKGSRRMGMDSIVKSLVGGR